MANGKASKVKLLRLYEILRSETDEDHPITTQELCAKLEDEGISCDRRTLPRDINCLRDLGYEVMETKVSYHKAYYYEDLEFSVPELKIMTDAIQAASFITEKKSEDLISKISDLGGIHRSEVLKGNMITFNTRKHTNEAILTNVSQINEAISSHKKISFQYYDLDENHEKRFRKNKKKYKEDPVALVYNEDNYYLLCYSEKYKTNVNYRVDRMYTINILSEDVSEEATEILGMLPDYTKQAFKMFDGEVESVTIEFDDSLLGAIYDKFGEDTVITRTAKNKCQTTVSVQVSSTFWGWIFQFGNRLKIISPIKLKDEMLTNLKNLEILYAEN